MQLVIEPCTIIVGIDYPILSGPRILKCTVIGVTRERFGPKLFIIHLTGTSKPRHSPIRLSRYTP